MIVPSPSCYLRRSGILVPILFKDSPSLPFFNFHSPPFLLPFLPPRPHYRRPGTTNFDPVSASRISEMRPSDVLFPPPAFGSQSPYVEAPPPTSLYSYDPTINGLPPQNATRLDSQPPLSPSTIRVQRSRFLCPSFFSRFVPSCVTESFLQQKVTEGVFPTSRFTYPPLFSLI